MKNWKWEHVLFSLCLCMHTANTKIRMKVIRHAGVDSRMIILDDQACQQMTHHFQLSLKCNVLPITGVLTPSWHSLSRLCLMNPWWSKHCIEVTIGSDESFVGTCAWSSKIIILLTNTKIVSPQYRLVCSNMQQPYKLHMGDNKLLHTVYGWRQAFTHSIWVTTGFYAHHMGDDKLLSH